MYEKYKPKWYNSPRLMLGLFLLGVWEPLLLFPACIVFFLHLQHHHAMLQLCQNIEEREEELRGKECAAEDKLLQAKLDANELISRAAKQKAFLEMEILELKKESASLTRQLLEDDLKNDRFEK